MGGRPMVPTLRKSFRHEEEVFLDSVAQISSKSI
jgi:hypothetical protein